MTQGEQTSLNQLATFIHEWRMEDKQWKTDASARLKKLEDDKVARDAVAEDRQQAWSKSIWKIAAIVGFMSTTLAGVTVAALRMFLSI